MGTRASLYLLVFLTEVVWMAIVPVAPDLAAELRLSGLELGTILGAGSVATLVVSLPVGFLSDRFGAHRVTVTAAAVVALSTAGQGLASDYWALLVSRAAFGVGMGAIWTAGVAWLASLGRSRGASALAGTMTAAGAGIMVGPVLAGTLAGELGLEAPFLALAVATGLATVALVRADHSGVAVEPSGSLRDLVSGVRERYVLAGLLTWVLIGFVNGSLNLLVPLGLEGNGLGAGEVGVAFTVSSSIFVVMSFVLSRVGLRAVRLELAGIAALAYAAFVLVGVWSAATVALLVLVVGRSPSWALLSTLAYPFGAVGAERAGIGRGAVMGALNFVWAAGNAVGPLVAGALADGAGLGWAFLPSFVVCLAAGCWLVASGRRRRDPVVEAGYEPIAGG